MTVHHGGNYSRDKLSDFNPQNGDVYEEANFLQTTQNTEIASGVTGLTFRRCLLVNCDLPPDAVKESCRHVQKDFCYHLHPTWGLPVEVDNCRHVVDIDTVTIDGVVIDTTYYREDIIV